MNVCGCAMVSAERPDLTSLDLIVLRVGRTLQSSMPLPQEIEEDISANPFGRKLDATLLARTWRVLSMIGVAGGFITEGCFAEDGAERPANQASTTPAGGHDRLARTLLPTAATRDSTTS